MARERSLTTAASPRLAEPGLRPQPVSDAAAVFGAAWHARGRVHRRADLLGRFDKSTNTRMAGVPVMTTKSDGPVIVIGGGIGGLAAAVALRLVGVPAAVY